MSQFLFRIAMKKRREKDFKPEVYRKKTNRLEYNFHNKDRV